MKQNYPKGFWKGLLIILVAYTLVQLVTYMPDKPAFLGGGIGRQWMRWLTILIVYLTGVWVLHHMEPQWIAAIWHLIHAVLIGFLLLSAFIEFSWGPLPYAWRASVAPMVEFLISPVLYFGAGILYKSMKTT